MGLFRPSIPSFRAIGTALGLLEADAATTQYETGPVRPRMDVQASIEAEVNYSEFVFLRTDVGAVTSIVDIRPHVLGDWAEIIHRNSNFVGVAGSEVPPTHDAWVIYVGAQVSTLAPFTSGEIFSEASTVGAGASRIEYWFGDDAVANGGVTRGSAHDSPIMIPLPWWVPPTVQQTSTLKWRLVTSAAVSTNLSLGIISAPPGVFKRLY